MKNKINILIADDHHYFIDGIKNHLSSFENIGHIHTANNGNECLKIMENNQIDILISDIDMPKMHGIELSRKLKQEKPEIKIIIVTQFADREHILPLIKIKTDAILDKADAKNEIKNSISAILDNKNYYSPKIQELVNSIILRKKIKQKHGVIPHLTRREKEFLPYIAQGLSNKEITTKLQNLSQKIILSPHTIEGHRKNLYLKFEVRNAAQLAKKVNDFGIIN